MVKILVVDELAAPVLDEMRQIDGAEVVVLPKIENKAEKKAAILKIGAQGFDALVVRSTEIDKGIIAGIAGLEIIVRAGSGIDNIDVASAKSRGIQVLNTPGANALSVKELAIGHILNRSNTLPNSRPSSLIEFVFGEILNHARSITLDDGLIKAGKFPKGKLYGTVLNGLALGIRNMAESDIPLVEVANALGMTVIYTSNVIDREILGEKVDEATLVANSKYLKVNVPWQFQQRIELDIARKGGGALLVNTEGKVDKDTLMDGMAGRLQGRVFGIYGYGRIGQGVAELLHVFGARTVFYDPVLDIPENGSSRIGSVEELLKNSDVVCLHANLNSENRGVLNANTIPLIGGKQVVNLSRAELVVEGDAVRALDEGVLESYATDVHYGKSAGPLAQHPKSLATAHQGAETDYARRGVGEESVAHLRKWAAGKGSMPRPVAAGGSGNGERTARAQQPVLAGK